MEDEFFNVFILDKSDIPHLRSLSAYLNLFHANDSTIESPLNYIYTADTSTEYRCLVRHLGLSSRALFSAEIDRMNNDYDPTQPGKESLVGFFPGLGSRNAYRNLGTALWDTGIKEIQDIYIKAAEVLGLKDASGAVSAEKIMFIDHNMPEDPIEKTGYIGVAFVVHNMALHAYLKAIFQQKDVPVYFSAYTGESLGILCAAISSGAVSMEDGLKIAAYFTPACLHAAEQDVKEAYHVVGIRSDQINEITRASQKLFNEDFEVHKYFSGQPTEQVNVYIAHSRWQEFSGFMSNHFPDADVTELKPPTNFIAHSSKLASARAELDRFMSQSNITFNDPSVPIISNHDNSVLINGAAVRDAILAMTDKPMDSRDTVDLIDGFQPTMTVEIGLGGKTRGLVEQNHMRTPYVEFTGADHFVITLEAIDRLNQFKSQIDTLRRSGQAELKLDQFNLLREIFAFLKDHPEHLDLFNDYVSGLIQSETIAKRHTASLGYQRMLEVYQNTHRYNNFIDIEKGELVLNALVKRPISSDGTISGNLTTELFVLGENDETNHYSIVEQQEFNESIVFNFSAMSTSSTALAPKAAELINNSISAREVYEEIAQAIGVDSLDYFTNASPKNADQQSTQIQRIAYQLAMFQVMTEHRQAIFAQNFKVSSFSDETGLVIGLILGGYFSVAEGIGYLDQLANNRSGVKLHEGNDSTGMLRVPILYQNHYIRTYSDVEKVLQKIESHEGLSFDPVRSNHNMQRVTFDADAPQQWDNKPDIVIAGLNDVIHKGVNPVLDKFESSSLFALTYQNEKVFLQAEKIRVSPSVINAYLSSREQVVAFGQGGSESLTLILLDDQGKKFVRKILSGMLASVQWDQNGVGVMLPPYEKAKRQAEFLMGLPDTVRPYFPEVFAYQERVINVPRTADSPGRIYKEFIYDMSFMTGMELSEFVRKHQPSPEIVAHIYEVIFHLLREKVHNERRRVPEAESTLEPSYFKKIEDRLALSAKTAPSLFSPDLLDSDYIKIDGQRYRNINTLLKEFREHPEYLKILEPKFHSLVVGDTNSENVFIGNVDPILEAMQTGIINFTAEDIDLKFIDPRAIGFHEDGKDTGADDPMYDNKPWHNSLGHYDQMHHEHFSIELRQNEVVPSIERTFFPENPYRTSYEGLEHHFNAVMTQAWDLDNPDSKLLKEDPYWLIRFVFVMGTHFTAMPPFHFARENDGRLIETADRQKRTLAIYAEGIQWLNLALDMLEGKVTDYHGFAVPKLP